MGTKDEPLVGRQGSVLVAADVDRPAGVGLETLHFGAEPVTFEHARKEGDGVLVGGDGVAHPSIKVAHGSVIGIGGVGRLVGDHRQPVVDVTAVDPPFGLGLPLVFCKRGVHVPLQRHLRDHNLAGRRAVGGPHQAVLSPFGVRRGRNGRVGRTCARSTTGDPRAPRFARFADGEHLGSNGGQQERGVAQASAREHLDFHLVTDLKVQHGAVLHVSAGHVTQEVGHEHGQRRVSAEGHPRPFTRRPDPGHDVEVLCGRHRDVIVVADATAERCAYHEEREQHGPRKACHGLRVRRPLFNEAVVPFSDPSGGRA